MACLSNEKDRSMIRTRTSSHTRTPSMSVDLVDEPRSDDESSASSLCEDLFDSESEDEDYVWKVDPSLTASGNVSSLLNGDAQTPGQLRMQRTIDSLERRAIEEDASRKKRHERRAGCAKSTSVRPSKTNTQQSATKGGKQSNKLGAVPKRR